MTHLSGATDATATAVGWVAIEAARVELAGAQLAAAMIGDPRALSVLVGQGWAATKQALEVLIRDRLADIEPNAEGRIDIAFLEETRASVRRADKLMEERATVVHALWELPLGEGMASVTLKRWGKHRYGDWTLEALSDLRGNLRSALDELAAHFEREVLARSGE